jgi:septal ring factor EnvC (AmiA/AmiB activator)
MALENLKLLEEKIGGFLARHEQVCNEKAALAIQLKEKEQEYSALIEKIHQFERERSEMRAILEKILSRFEGLDLQ